MSHAHYLHPEQRERIRQLYRRRHWRLELPTGIMAAVYGGWFAVALGWQTLGRGWRAAVDSPDHWYMSLQHELIHGHPTRWPRVNQLFGLLPLAVWYPYGLYRDSHLRHHRNDHLTDPHEDPESYYFSAAQWRRYPRLLPLLAAVRNTLIGRVLLGPALDIAATTAGAVKALASGEWRTDDVGSAPVAVGDVAELAAGAGYRRGVLPAGHQLPGAGADQGKIVF